MIVRRFLSFLIFQLQIPMSTGKIHRRFSCFISEDKPESGLDRVDSQLDNIGGRITALYSKMCSELGADLQVQWRIQDFPERCNL